MKKLIVIAGPTAIGKTNLAIHLAKQLKTVIISCDSRQFFREMTIGTAKPSTQELAQVTHYFINSLSITDTYTVGDYARDCHQLLKQLYQKHDSVIMCGGSGLYIKAVCDGLDEFPDIPPHIRPALNEQYETKGITSLQEQLAHLDPLCYQTIDRHNPQRLLRALEVCIASGQPYSDFLRKKNEPSSTFEPVKIMLNTDRAALYERINRRVDQMLSDGLVEEVRGLQAYQHLNALQTVGYQELFDHFSGNITYEHAIALIKQNTRRYAKRQLTWFRKDPDYHWFEAHDQIGIEQLLV